MSEDHISDDIYLSYIINPNNKLLTKQIVHLFLKKYNVSYTIKNLKIFQQAMTHKSYIIRDYGTDKNLKNIHDKGIQPIDLSLIKNFVPIQKESYERLEYLGDSAIHVVIAQYLYDRYPDQQEGFLTRLRTKIENDKMLAHIACVIGLHEYVILARHCEVQCGREKNTFILGDIFESFVGALFKDSDSYDICKKFIINVIEKEIDIPLLLHKETNYKDTLLQYFHRMKWNDPKYELLETIEPNKTNNPKKLFKMCIIGPNNEIFGTGISSKKKNGEQTAAQYALVKLGVINFNSEDSESCEYSFDELL